MTNFRELLHQVKREVGEATTEEIRDRLSNGDELVLLDVREKEEWASGVIPGARLLSRAHFESRVEDVLGDKDAEVVVYCATGVRSVFGAKTLRELGYSNVRSLAGGFVRWRDLGFDYSIPKVLTTEQHERYSRHLLLPEVGLAGQQKLLEAKVLALGAGGLGAPALEYLAAAGVGTIGIVDDDVVEGSNLQRQVIHSTETIGQPKAESARDFIKRLNPDIDVKVYAFRLNETNVHEIIADYDVIVDGTDNFDTRYIVNDAAVELRKPVVHGSIFRFEGMASTFVPFEGPCYRCLYPEAPPPELAPT
jgi:molybdopterin/thiamine biosynthesis adenylyltransferase/rhodanese-related sulfurtransferase